MTSRGKTDDPGSAAAQMAVLSRYRVVEGAPMPMPAAKSFLETLDEMCRDAEANFLKTDAPILPLGDKESDMAIVVDEPGTHKVVDAADLERETRAGWRLVRVVMCDAPIRYISKPAEQGCQANSWQSTYEQYAEQIGTVSRFLVAKGRATEAMDLRDQLEALRAEKDAAEKRSAVLVKDSEKMADSLAKTERALDSEKTVTAAQRATIEQETARVRKMEMDVAKLRRAIGDLRMKEILEG